MVLNEFVPEPSDLRFLASGRPLSLSACSGWRRSPTSPSRTSESGKRKLRPVRILRCYEFCPNENKLDDVEPIEIVVFT